MEGPPESGKDILKEGHLNIKTLGEEYRVLEFDSQNPKIYEAYLAAIADVLSRVWADDHDGSRQEHVKEIILQGHTNGEENKGGYFSMPLSFHDALVVEDDATLMEKIHEKAYEIYSQITT